MYPRHAPRLAVFAVALCAALSLASPAQAAGLAGVQPLAPNGGVVADVDAAAAATSEVTISKLVYQPDDGGAPLNLAIPGDVVVTIWKLDVEWEIWEDVTDTSPVTYRDETGEWVIGSLAAGTYSFRFDAYPDYIGSEYYDDARYFYDSNDVVVAEGSSVPLGEIVLTPRVFDVWRLTGQDRFGTAVEASRQTVAPGETVDTVYLADGTNYPDALAAGPAAIAKQGILLLTSPKVLPAVTKQRLIELAPQRVIVLGQANSVSDAVFKDVKKALPAASVERFSGTNRFVTAEMIIRDAFPAGDTPVAFMVTGRNFPDALSAGAAAGHIGAPVILVEGGSKTLPADTKKLLTDLGVQQVFIAGGTNMVSAGIEKDLATLLGAEGVYRFAGGNRYETAMLINYNFFDRPDYGILTTGAKFPDALAGTVLAGALGAPLHLTEPNCLSLSAASVLLDHRSNGAVLLGGPTTLSPAVENLQVCQG
ncbi:cell wall-binding repeat-containing protein [Microbacterium sp. SSM24]|uniref:cell wall-binding repeat-containing protein n=1 Tax=Microbacterium sp. SSM24 TaxID=2991714 RepID=UPI002226586F|nr:cell wall-binding repeat-containing protein [Microbacterium sp. SSM24]MCW3493976.1 cell wall-binding repeat-containing protein [Microbacterium sp. SSM24]